MCQYPRQIERQIHSQIRQIAYLNSKYRVMTKHYVSCNRRPILEKHLNHSCVKQVRQTDTLVFQWIARKKKQDRRSYSSSELFGSLSLVDNTDVGNRSDQLSRIICVSITIIPALFNLRHIWIPC